MGAALALVDAPNAVGCGHYAKQWFVGQTTATGFLKKAAAHTQAQGFEALFPQVEIPTGPGRANSVKPMFGCCFFIQFDRSDTRWKTLLFTPVTGIRRIFGATGTSQPTPLRRGELEALRSRLNSNDVLEYDPQAGSSTDLIKLGDLFTIAVGAHAGFPAICTWTDQERVTLLYHMFGRPVETTMNATDLDRA